MMTDGEESYSRDDWGNVCDLFVHWLECHAVSIVAHEPQCGQLLFEAGL